MRIYYTYAYLREDRTPYYIGKGHGNRCYESSGRHVPTPKDPSRITLLKQGLSEEEAFRHECYIIFILGRKDLGTGILRNLTNGGEGASGAVRSEETRKILAERKQGEENPNYGNSWYHNPETGEERCFCEPPEGWSKGRSPTTRQILRESKLNRGVTQETKEKIRKIRTGTRASKETKEKMSASRSGPNNPNFGKKFRWWVNANGETSYREESPGLEWKPGRKWK
jgi:hypothetical protein